MSTADEVPLFVPTRPAGGQDVAALRVGRRPDGVRVGIAFTRLDLLRAACGPRQDWLRLPESDLRAVLSPLGVGLVVFDPDRIGTTEAEPVPAVTAPVPAVGTPLPAVGVGPVPSAASVPSVTPAPVAVTPAPAVAAAVAA